MTIYQFIERFGEEILANTNATLTLEEHRKVWDDFETKTEAYRADVIDDWHAESIKLINGLEFEKASELLIIYLCGYFDKDVDKPFLEVVRLIRSTLEQQNDQKIINSIIDYCWILMDMLFHECPFEFTLNEMQLELKQIKELIILKYPNYEKDAVMPLRFIDMMLEFK